MTAGMDAFLSLLPPLSSRRPHMSTVQDALFMTANTSRQPTSTYFLSQSCLRNSKSSRWYVHKRLRWTWRFKWKLHVFHAFCLVSAARSRNRDVVTQNNPQVLLLAVQCRNCFLSSPLAVTAAPRECASDKWQRSTVFVIGQNLNSFFKEF